MTKETPTKSGSVWPLALGAIAATFGGLIPLPSVDYESLRMLTGQSGDLWDLSVGPIGNTMGALVLAYAFALSSKRTWAWRAALVFYLACALVQGLGIAFWLEGLNSGYGGLGGLNPVPDPGWAFRSTVMLAYAAGASILWLISKSIDASKRATGALFLLLIDVFIDQLGVFSSYGQGLAHGTLAWSQALPLLSMPVSMLVLAYVIYRRPTVTWPVMLWRWKLRSHIDVIALVAVAVLPGTLFRLGSIAGIDDGWFDLFDALIALGLGASASRWWWSLATAEDAQDRPIKSFVAIGLATLALLGMLSAAFVGGGGIERLNTPGPLEGSASFALTLDAETRFEAEDAQRMVALLEELGANAEIVSADERSITLEVHDAVSRDSVLEVLTPVRFRISPVLDIRQLATPDVLRRGAHNSYDRYLSGECAAFEDLVDAAVPAGAAPGCRYSIQRGLGTEPCLLYCLGREEVLSNGDVLEADATLSEYEGGRPLVSVVLSDEGARRFANYTADHIREAIAIEINDEVLSAPIVQDRISGGRLQITLGQADDYRVLLQESERLAAGLRAGVQTAWRLRDSE